MSFSSPSTRSLALGLALFLAACGASSGPGDLAHGDGAIGHGDGSTMNGDGAVSTDAAVDLAVPDLNPAVDLAGVDLLALDDAGSDGSIVTDLASHDMATGFCNGKADGTVCDDGNACTQTDSCQAGACVGASPVSCTASDACHAAGICSPLTGVCTNPAKANGTSCDDGSACTQVDTCQAGVCTGGSPKTCAASDQCHAAGTCDATTGACTNPLAADGTSCNDGDACTQTDTCQAGTCTGASPVTCSALDPCHVAGACNPTTGACSNPAAPNGTSCSDGNACTQLDTCQVGACTGSSPVICAPLDQCHAAGMCDSTTGACSNPAVSDGTTCNDGMSCTDGDSCLSGTCGGTLVVCTDNGNQCVVANACDPSGGCTTANQPAGTACSQSGGTVCDGAGACVTAPAVSTTSPADASTSVAGASIAVTFTVAMDPTTLTGQTAAGACSGSVQVSLDGFASCIAFVSASATMSGGDSVATFVPAPGLLVNRTYKIRVTTAAQSATAVALPAQYTQPTGFSTTSPDLCDGSVVVSQVYGGGGSSNATYQNDYIELFNRGSVAVSLAGWAVQYATTSGTSWAKTPLSGSIPPGGYFLVQGGGNSGLAPLPTADLVGTINMSATAGKIALTSTTTTLTGACGTGGAIVDLVGYGTANCSEGASAAPAPSTTRAVLRQMSGCADVNSNGSDFTVVPPVPRNSASSANVCACVAQNESGATLEADFCDVQFPGSLSVTTGTQSAIVYGQVFEMGTTEAAGAAANVRMQLGYGPQTANPEYEPGWSWTNATYNVQSGNNDEYQASFTAPAVGTYAYAYRVSLDSGVSWTLCDGNTSDGGAGSNAGLSFDFASEPVLTVTP